jgi:glucosylceramidase
MNMKQLLTAGLSSMMVACVPNTPEPSEPDKVYSIEGPVSVYMSTVDQTHLFTQVEDAQLFLKQDAPSSGFDITLNPNKQFQTILGSGASFTDSSAYLINQVLSLEDKEDLMKKLFDREEGIGLSFIRQPMGASDFARTMYTYNDRPKGETDESLEYFSIDHDRADIIPLLKQALELNPSIKIMASPWTAPGWMKSTDHWIGGQLNPQNYEVYGQYFARFIQAYQAEGLDIYAITPQNEPLYVPAHYPGMGMNAMQQTNFIRRGLVPAFQKAGLDTKILIYDHNWDRKDYPLDILRTIPELVSGVAWHVYGGQVNAMSEVVREFPNHDVYFTEASGGEWVPPFEAAFLGAIKTGIDVFRNYSKTYVMWNFALDENNGPVVPGFGRSTVRGMVTINQETKELTYNLDYYVLAHFSKFTQQDAIRIDSTRAEGNFTSVAFLNPDQSVNLVVYNMANQSRNALIHLNQQTIVVPMQGKGVATITFKLQSED